MSLISLQNISVAYDKSLILKDFSLDIEQGEFISLLGPSGCGKTTTLRLIAGFLEARDGKFLFGDKDYTRVPVSKRNFGFVFQSYALFPHMSIFNNVAFGLKLRKMGAQEIEKRVTRMLEVVNLHGFADRFPAELSGGQRQRVAIARALVIEPDLLLFDEPLSNLDANLRVNMRVEIRRIQQELGITTVYVSHDQEECFSISDKVAIMNNGIIEQLASPAVIYKYPETEYVARFIGFTNFIRLDGASENNGIVTGRVGENAVFQVVNRAGTDIKETMQAAIRPDDLKVGTEEEMADASNAIPGTVKINTFLGRSYQYIINTELGDFTANREMEAPFASGTRVKVVFPEDKIVLLNR